MLNKKQGHEKVLLVHLSKLVLHDTISLRMHDFYDSQYELKAAKSIVTISRIKSLLSRY